MEQHVNLTRGQNKLTLHVVEAKSIEILDAAEQVISSKKGDYSNVLLSFYLREGTYRIVTDGKIGQATTETEDISSNAELARLILSSDAPDRHKVDGIPEIPADGESFTIIIIQKVSAQYEPMTGRKDNDEVFLRTNAGSIKDDGGKEEIRSLILKKGQGAFRLYSEERKRLATVQVLPVKPYIANTSIAVEFY